MSLISASNLGLSFGHRDIFAGISVEIPHGAKTGLVGPNGVGKTSLLRMLAGLSIPSDGTIHRARDMTLGYLRQEAVEAFAGRHHSVYTEMLTVFTHLQEQGAALRQMEKRMEKGDADDALLGAYGAALEQFTHQGGYEYDLRIRQVLQGLGMSEHHDTPIDHLSGGQKTRALLARLLLEGPDLLILDEPTNHLDVQAVEWLEKALCTWEGGLLVASHDRFFLDRVVNRIWEMTPTHIEVYRGNYSAYAQQRQERWERRLDEHERERERLAKDLEVARRYFAWRKFDEAHGRMKRLGRELMAIEKFGLLGAKDMRWSETHLRSAREMSVEEAHERIKAIKPLADRPPRLHLRLHSSGRSGEMVLRSDGLRVGYPGKHLFTTGPLRLDRLERVGILGPNGSGKTTFLRTLLGDLPPLSGEMELGASLKVGYFAQAHDGLKGDSQVLDALLQQKNVPIGEARNYLAQYLFRGEDVYKPVSALSGGERARLALAILTLQGVNLLLLDEPTNHLDIAAQEVLQEGLESFEGTVLLVSHDRYLVSEVATQIWEIRDEQLHIFKGSYAELIAEREAPVSRIAEAPTVKASSRSLKPEKEERRRIRMLEQLEAQIAEAERTLAHYSTQMQADDPKGDYMAVAHLAESYATLEGQLQELLSRWEVLAVDKRA